MGKICNRKMCQANNEKQEKTHKGRKRDNKPRKIITLGEKETYKFLRILEADYIK